MMKKFFAIVFLFFCPFLALASQNKDIITRYIIPDGSIQLLDSGRDDMIIRVDSVINSATGTIDMYDGATMVARVKESGYNSPIYIQGDLYIQGDGEWNISYTYLWENGSTETSWISESTFTREQVDELMIWYSILLVFILFFGFFFKILNLYKKNG